MNLLQQSPSLGKLKQGSSTKKLAVASSQQSLDDEYKATKVKRQKSGNRVGSFSGQVKLKVPSKYSKPVPIVIRKQNTQVQQKREKFLRKNYDDAPRAISAQRPKTGTVSRSSKIRVSLPLKSHKSRSPSPNQLYFKKNAAQTVNFSKGGSGNQLGVLQQNWMADDQNQIQNQQDENAYSNQAYEPFTHGNIKPSMFQQQEIGQNQNLYMQTSAQTTSKKFGSVRSSASSNQVLFNQIEDIYDKNSQEFDQNQQDDDYMIPVRDKQDGNFQMVSQKSSSLPKSPKILKSLKPKVKRLSPKYSSVENYEQKANGYQETNVNSHRGIIYPSQYDSNYQEIAIRPQNGGLKRHYASTEAFPIQNLEVNENRNSIEQKEIITDSISSLQDTNKIMRHQIQKIGLSVTGLASSSYNLKKEFSQRDSQSQKALISNQIKDISSSIDTINSLFNDVHFQILKNDDNLTTLSSSWFLIQSSNSSIHKISSLQSQLKKLSEIHNSLQQKMFKQSQENKLLKGALQNNTIEKNDQQNIKSHQMVNLEQLLQDSRNDNKYLIRRIDELAKDIQAKNGQIMGLKQGSDKKTPAFVPDNNSSSVNDTNLHNFWKSNSERLMIHSQKFLQSMKTLQKAVNVKGKQQEPIDKETLTHTKQDFEVSKKILEQLIKQTKKDIQKSPTEMPEQFSALKLQISDFHKDLVDEKAKNVQKENEIRRIQGKFDTIAQQNLLLQKELGLIESQEQKNDFQKVKDLQKSVLDLKTEAKRLKEENLKLIQGKEETENKLKVALTSPKKTLKAPSLLKGTKSTQTDIEENIKENKGSTSTISSESEKKVLTKKTVDLESQIDQLENQVKTQELAIKNIKDQNKALSSQTDKLKIEKSKDLASIEVLQIQTDELQNIIDDLKQEQKQKQKIITPVKLEDKVNNIMKEQIDALQQKYDELTGKLKETQETNAFEKSELQNQIEAKSGMEQALRNVISEQSEKLQLKCTEIDTIKVSHSQSLDILGQAKASLQQDFNSIKEEKEQAVQECARKEQVMSQQIQELKDEIQEKTDKQDEYKEEIKNLNSDQVQAEQIREKHQQTLEKNRDLIALLKEQLQKSVEKQKALDSNQNSQHKLEIQREKTDLIQQENSKLKKDHEKSHNQNEALKEQVKQLKVQFSEKVNELNLKNLQIEEENKLKQDLIAEANSAIEELTDNKHDFKAKFKHLVQVYVQNISQSVNQSSYKGDESSLSINDCFEQIENVLAGALENKDERPMNQILGSHETFRKSSEVRESTQKLLLQVSTLKQDLEGQKSKFENIKKQLDITVEMLTQNDDEIQRQIKSVTVAKRKIQNYKKLVNEKIEMIKQQKDKEKFYKDQQESSQIKFKVQTDKISKEMSKLVDQVNQQQIEMKINKDKLITNDKQMMDLKKKEEEQKKQISDLEKQLAEDKRQSKQDNQVTQEKEQQKSKKDHNDSSKNSSDDDTDSKQEQIDQLETENMDLIMKLQKLERDLQELRDKQVEAAQNKEDKDDQTELNEETKQKMEELKSKLEELHSTILLAKSDVTLQIQTQFFAQINEIKQKYDASIIQKGVQPPDQEVKVVNNDLKLVETVVVLVNGMKSKYFVIVQENQVQGKGGEEQQDEKVYFVKQEDVGEEQQRYLESFLPKYSNQMELPNDLEDFGTGIDKSETPNTNMDEFKKRVAELRSEQMEIVKEFYDLRLKLEKNVDIIDEKDLHSLKDDVQFFQADNIELRHKVKVLVDHNMRLINEQHQQKQSIEDKNIEDKQELSNLFKDAGEVIQGESNNQQLQSSSLILSQYLFDEEPNKSSSFSKKSSIEDVDSAIISIKAVEMSHNQVDETQVSVLESKLKDANYQITQLHQELKAENWGKALNDSKIKIKKISIIEQEVDNSLNQSKQSQNENSVSRDSGNSYRNLIQHVKGTLITYLKKTPIVDLQNEILLKIIYSMMEFTKAEISDIQQAREELPIYKVDVNASKLKKKERDASSKRLSSQNASQNSSGTVNTEEIKLQEGLGKNLMEQMRSSLVSQAKSSTPKSGEKENKAKSSLLGLFKRSNDKQMPKPQDIQSRNNMFEFKQQETPKGSVVTAGSVSEEHQIAQPPLAPISGPANSKIPDDSDINIDSK